MPTDYGSAIRSVTVAGSATLDMDRYWRRITGPMVVAYAVARRLVTRRGSLPWAPDVGFDVRSILLDGFRVGDLPTYERLIAAEAEADERVLAADVTLSFDPATETARIDINLTLASGPFPLVLEVSKVSLEILRPAA